MASYRHRHTNRWLTAMDSRRAYEPDLYPVTICAWRSPRRTVRGDQGRSPASTGLQNLQADPLDGARQAEEGETHATRPRPLLAAASDRQTRERRRSVLLLLGAVPAHVADNLMKQQPRLNVGSDGRPIIGSKDYSGDSAARQARGNFAPWLRMTCNRHRKSEGRSDKNDDQLSTHGRITQHNTGIFEIEIGRVSTARWSSQTKFTWWLLGQPSKPIGGLQSRRCGLQLLGAGWSRQLGVMAAASAQITMRGPTILGEASIDRRTNE